MTWIVGIVKFRNTLIHECKLVPYVQLRSKMTLEEMNETEEYIEAGYPVDGVQLIRVDNDVVNNIEVTRCLFMWQIY